MIVAQRANSVDCQTLAALPPSVPTQNARKTPSMGFIKQALQDKESGAMSRAKKILEPTTRHMHEVWNGTTQWYNTR